jgi:transcriptional regulator with XRE-family HTH domain
MSLADVAKLLGAASRNAYASDEQGTREPTLGKFRELLGAVAPEMTLILGGPRDEQQREWRAPPHDNRAATGSQQPLFVTATRADVAAVAESVRAMHGEHRIPTLLKRVDRLARES